MEIIPLKLRLTKNSVRHEDHWPHTSVARVSFCNWCLMRIEFLVGYLLGHESVTLQVYVFSPNKSLNSKFQTHLETVDERPRSLCTNVDIQGPVVELAGNATQRIEIYPTYSVIQPSNNWGQMCKIHINQIKER